MENFESQLNIISDRIRRAEADLINNHHIIEATYGELSWKRHDNGRFRIYLGDRPLIENKIGDRIRGISQINGLLKACNEAMKSQLDKFFNS